MTLGGCARDRALQPRTGTGLSLKVSTAPRGSAQPIVGAVDTLRVEVRDADGAGLAELIIPVTSGQRMFQAALDVPIGTERIVTVMGIGPRPLGTGEAQPTDRGILFLDRLDNVDIQPGQSVPLAITLRLFVPEFLAPELLDGTAHRLRWHRVPGAVRYELRRATNGAPIVTSLTDTTFLGEGLPADYQLRAFELGGRRSAASDPVTVALPLPPAVPAGLTATGISPTQIDLGWRGVVGAGAVTYDLERRIEPSPTFAALAGALPVTTLSDTGVDTDHTYHYRVRAVGRGGMSDWSAEVTGNARPQIPGAPTGLSADAVSATLVKLAWTKGPGRVDAYDMERRVPPAAFAVLTTVTGDKTGYDDASVLELTSYEYRVIPRNVSGVGPASNVAAVTTPAMLPNAPSGLAATPVSPTEIDLAWVDNSTNETGFELQRAEGGGGAFATIVEMRPDEHAFADIKLAESSFFRYRVRAIKNGVASDWSAEAGATTPGAPPAAPSALAALVLGATSVRLTWVDNASNEDSVGVERENPDGGWIRVTGLPANTVTTDVTGLQPSTNYTFRVVAINAAGEASSESTPVATPPTVPSAPTQLAGSAPAYNRVVLTWLDTADNETGFDILRQEGDISLFFTAGVNAAGFTDTSVKPSTPYNYSVRARNATSTSGYAGPVRVTTPPGPPSAPPNFAATPVGSSVIGLSWSPSTGNPTTYLLEMRLPPADFAPLVTVASTIVSRLVTDLMPNTTYGFRIKAHNNIGDSDWSPEVSAKTAQALPDTPVLLPGEALAGGASVRLTWVDNSTNETSFTIEGELNASGTFATLASPGANETSAVIQGLTPSTSYNFRMAALNELGPSPWSNTILVRTLAAPPASPVNLIAVGETSSRITLHWQPGSGGGAPVDYSIERRQPSEPTFTPIATITAGAPRLDYGDNALLPDTDYQYRIRARNAVGFSAYSDTASARTLLDPPGAPVGFVAAPVPLTSTQIRLDWNPPASGGAPAFYDLFIRVLGDQTYGSLTTMAAPIQTYVATGLTPSTTYELQVKARNATASSVPALASATTYLPAPTAPSELNGYRPDDDTEFFIVLDWTDNSPSETSFELQRAPDTGVLIWAPLVTLQENVSSYIDYGATSTTHYRVRAANAGGLSDWSNEVSINPEWRFLPIPANFVPNPLSASQIRLEWGDSATNETGYQIQSGTQGGAGSTWTPLVSLPPGSTSYLLAGLSPSVTYYFRIRTLGSLGQNSEWWEISAQTAASAPAAPTNLSHFYISSLQMLTLSWRDNSYNESRFDISRRVNAGPLVLMGSVGINQRSFVDPTAPVGTQLTYYVTAVNSAGESTSTGYVVTI